MELSMNTPEGRAWRIGTSAFLACLLANSAFAQTQEPKQTLTNTAAAAVVSGTNQVAVTNNAEADRVWRETSRALQSPMPLPAWQEKAPTREEEAAHYMPFLEKAVEKARDFYTRFPDHPKAEEARKKEFNLLTLAAQKYGDTNSESKRAVLTEKIVQDPKTSEDERFRLRMELVQKAARDKMEEGKEAFLAELERGARAMLRDFPKRTEVYQLLMQVAAQSESEKQMALVQEIVDGPAPDQVKNTARGMLKKADALGKPVSIQYTAIDGRKVDLAALKGKVVLVDFWATWCGPCIAELPEVKAAYTKLHDKGFEIVGISFDHEKSILEKFVAKEKMPWPQFFEDQGPENRYGLEFGISGIPTMWLVDKKGNLRDMNARGGLAGRVEKLLAE